MPYPFLSDEWIAAVRELRQELPDAGATIPQRVRINLVVQEVPFGPGQVAVHLDTGSGQLELDTGHVTDQDLHVTVDYETAKAIIVDGHPQAAMQAFMTGKIQVEGDMAKLLLLQTTSPDPASQEMAVKLRELTAD